MLILYLILLFILVYFIFFVSQFVNIFFKGYAPYISTDRNTVKQIIEGIKIAEQAVVYELGCGNAVFLRMMERKFPAIKLIGVENLYSIYLINCLKFKLQNSNIKIVNDDFFNINFQKADLIYCYLNNETMEKLGKRFKLECKKGTLVISRRFAIPRFTAEKIIRIRNINVYFYKI